MFCLGLSPGQPMTQYANGRTFLIFKLYCAVPYMYTTLRKRRFDIIIIEGRNRPLTWAALLGTVLYSGLQN